MIDFGVGLQGNHIWDQLLAFESLIGREVDVTRAYQNWSAPIVDADVRAALAAGKTPLIAWHAFEADGSSILWADIAASKYDTDIGRVAGELIAGVGSAPARFVIHHEPEDEAFGTPAGQGQGRCGTAADFVAAFTHIRNKLRRAGVPRTTQIGACLMGGTYRGGHGGPDLWLPSTLKADFYASDGYSRDESSGQKPKSFVDTFGKAHDFAVARGKPFVIEECGVTEILGDPNFKANWFNEMATVVPAWNPDAVTYSHVYATNFGGQDYRVNSSPQALAAFKNFLLAISG